MDPREQFCRNRGCRAYGRKGEGHVVIHSRAERRHQCKRCRRTFAETAGTALYRLRTARDQVAVVVTRGVWVSGPGDRRAWGRTSDGRALQAGREPVSRVHEHLVEAGRVELGRSRPTSAVGSSGGVTGWRRPSRPTGCGSAAS